VTGGAHRLGAAIARELAARGGRVVIHCHRSIEEARRLSAGLPAGARGGVIRADLGRPQAPARLFAQLDRRGIALDAVVHSAASFVRQPLAALDAGTWDRIFALNLRAFAFLAQELGRRNSRRGGDLVAIADAAALELWPNYLAHSVAKAALLALTRTLAKAMAPAIRVNAVVPGAILPPPGTPALQLERFRRRTLVGKLGTPAEIARGVAFLLESDFATGSVLQLTGGSELRPATDD